MKQFLIPLTLAVLAGTTAEFLLGDQYLIGTVDPGQQLGMIVMFTVFYGSAAIIIREVARRTGRGWPTIVALALAFGLVEEGLATQTLFDPHYLGLDLLRYGHVDVLGIGVPWTVFVLGLHVGWSICTPIALAEALFPTHARPGAAPGGPWLQRWTLVVPVVLYLFGAVGTAIITWATDDHFVAHWWQLASALVLAVLVGAAAFSFTSRAPTAVRVAPPASAGPTLASAGFALAVGSAFHLARQDATWPAAITVTLQLAAVLAAVVGVRALRLTPFGVAVGALATYGWVGMAAAAETGPVGVAEQTVLLLIMAGVVALAWRRSVRRPTAERSATAASARGDEHPVGVDAEVDPAARHDAAQR